MCWCFAIINNKLTEIYFDRTKKENFKLKAEQKAIIEDIAKYRFAYRKGEYKKVEEK